MFAKEGNIIVGGGVIDKGKAYINVYVRSAAGNDRPYEDNVLYRPNEGAKRRKCFEIHCDRSIGITEFGDR